MRNLQISSSSNHLFEICRYLLLLFLEGDTQRTVHSNEHTEITMASRLPATSTDGKPMRGVPQGEEDKLFDSQMETIQDQLERLPRTDFSVLQYKPRMH